MDRPNGSPTGVGHPPTAVGHPPTAAGHPSTAARCPPTAVGHPSIGGLALTATSSFFFAVRDHPVDGLTGGSWWFYTRGRGGGFRGGTIASENFVFKKGGEVFL